MAVHVRVAGLTLGLLLAGVLVGCGGGSSTSTSTSASTPSAAVPISPSSSASDLSSDTQAAVAGKPIAQSTYQHWMTVEKKLGESKKASKQALGFLITSEWVLREAAARHITVSEAEVRKAYAHLLQLHFARPGSLQEFLTKAHETEADLLARIRVELLSTKIAAQVTKGKKGAKRTAALNQFEKKFQTHWKSLTNCKPGDVMEDCKQYKGKPEDLNAPEPVPPVSVSGDPTNGNAAASGETYNSPGGFLISSPAFERNGSIPAQYTCAGAGTSPPISWENVPSGTAELLLYVIDANPNDKPNWGKLWVVGGIDPSVKEIQAGHLSEGAVVGKNDLGKTEYTPICPAQGESTTVEFVMIALRKKMALSPGFDWATLNYGSEKLALETTATYGVATH